MTFPDKVTYKGFPTQPSNGKVRQCNTEKNRVHLKCNVFTFYSAVPLYQTVHTDRKCFAHSFLSVCFKQQSLVVHYLLLPFYA